MWTLGEFNTLAADAVTEGLLACCASAQWARKVVSGRPYGTLAALLAAAGAAFDELDEAEIEVAHAAHPRIGRPVQPAGTGQRTGAAWSRGEQSRALASGEAVRAALADANQAYEHRFGRVFLICATGLTGEEILAEAKRRLGNDSQTEAYEASVQLRKIVLLRLGKAVRA
ncbi:2-oxo-4-hydroxy-4-carboxy-5-ureidoimidazoline decarboxylase [Glycomyces buryatensis]|uniref:2-oxo-4-hydroxy-4-carboxy-5-ureidoimidazoline decarboxylase n=2 Tax=Glycomyces buryatensis TaxID=2570927 RepID=A0A4V4HQZ9_9ACTN|nr:2-oxo-4-hydroxy-4-carboxy-5-ureidoimidazoline decarboxylase [Glycomyces buryatensis]